MQESEVIAIPASASEVDILVGLRACSLTDDPGNYNITVRPFAINFLALSTAMLSGVHITCDGRESFCIYSFAIECMHSETYGTLYSLIILIEQLSCSDSSCFFGITLLVLPTCLAIFPPSYVGISPHPVLLFCLPASLP